MHPLGPAQSDGRLGELLGPRTGGMNNHPGGNLQRLAGLLILDLRLPAVGGSVGLEDFHIVGQDRTGPMGRSKGI
jgi:hypothetical protein